MRRTLNDLLVGRSRFTLALIALFCTLDKGASQSTGPVFVPGPVEWWI